MSRTYLLAYSVRDRHRDWPAAKMRVVEARIERRASERAVACCHDFLVMLTDREQRTLMRSKRLGRSKPFKTEVQQLGERSLDAYRWYYHRKTATSGAKPAARIDKPRT
jgi:hypothetical protein